MWCCVGSGMENHGKYNQFIYTHSNDSLFVNLFVASELNWQENGLKLRQETKFPYEDQTSLIVTEGAVKFKLMVRYPGWVAAGALKISVNGKPVKIDAKPSSYVAIDRIWRKGDKVQITLPMHNSVEKMPNVSNYVAIMHGPILLAAKTGTEDLKGLVADDGRWAHIASGRKQPIDQAPIIIENDMSKIAEKIQPVKGKPLTFTTANLKMVNSQAQILEPFFQLHDARYMMYWMSLNDKQYKSYIDSLAVVEKAKLELQKRTIDFVAPGEQQPEVDHQMQRENSNTGNTQDEFFRDARNEGYFSYSMATNSETNLCLIVRYWGADRGNRKFDILIDDQKLVTEDNTRKWNQEKFQMVEYAIPDEMVKGKKQVRVKFQALPGSVAGGVYYVRLARKK
jgi:hypothetical protein